MRPALITSSAFVSSGENIFALDKLIIPVNVMNSHWFVVCVDFAKEEIKAYDSFPPRKGGRMQYLELVFRYIKEEYERYHKCQLPFLHDWKLIPCPRGNQSVPVQIPGLNNCGVYTCILMELLMNNVNTCTLSNDEVQSAIEYSGRRSLWYSINKNRPIFQNYYQPRAYKERRFNDQPSSMTALFPCILLGEESIAECQLVDRDKMPYIEELSYHCHYTEWQEKYTDEDLDALEPLNEPWEFNFRPPVLHDGVDWSYNRESRVVTGNFTKVSVIDSEHKHYLGQLMERDDITVISEGLLLPITDLAYVLDAFSRENGDLPYETVRQFNRIKIGGRETYKEKTDGHVTMKVSDYVDYCNIIQGERPDQPFSYQDVLGERQSFDKATDVVFFMLDVYLPRHFQALNNEMKLDFKMKEILPGGDWCMLNAVSIINMTKTDNDAESNLY